MNDKYKFLFPTSDRESEFSGFDSVSEWDIACKLYMVEQFSDSSSVSVC
jgi:hypothetical protein